MVRSPYCVNGKAGSGRSTLMRFIYCSPCTQQVLHKRAGNLELEMASFLGGRFWGAGSRSWVEAPQDSPITSDYCYPSGGDYSAPRCRLLSSVQPYPQQVQQPLPQCLQPFKGPTSSFERLQRRAKLSRMLAGSRRLKGVIAFLEDLKIFRRYLDREWIVIILLPVSIAKIFQKVGDVPFAFRV
jgi:hypothetical protein